VKYYILEGEEVVEAENIVSWGEWFFAANRQIEDTTIEKVRVSAIFIGISVNPFSDAPTVFETMIFGGNRDLEKHLHCTFREAQIGHAAVVASFRL